LRVMEKYSVDRNCVVMSRDEVRAIDAWAINEMGVPGVVLMENAGRSCAELVKEKLRGIERPKVCIFCGTGNNGGDGYVIARHLLNIGYEVVVAVCGSRQKVRGDAKVNLDILEKLAHPIKLIDPKAEGTAERIKSLCRRADMLVDALFGTGLSGELRGGYKELIETVNEQGRPILAVDIPSGLDCDAGRPLGAAVKADYTVSFVAAKKGFENPAARQYTGEVYVASIGAEPRQEGS